MIVELEWYEMDVAINVGINRNTASWRNQRKHTAGYKPKDLFDTGIKAAAAELAVAKKLGLYWDGSVDTFKSRADVGNRTEVRMSSMRVPKLIVRPNDRSDRDYVLVVDLWEHGKKPKFDLVGWMLGREAMNEQYLTDNGNGRPPAYFVPVTDLRSMEDYDANY